LLVSVRAGVLDNLTAGAYLVHVYDRWNQARPWDWHQALGQVPNRRETFEGALVWTSLLVVLVVGLWSLWSARSAAADRLLAGRLPLVIAQPAVSRFTAETLDHDGADQAQATS
jgi:hypothetical protein